MKKRLAVVAAFSDDAVLKRKIRLHLRKLGFERTDGGSLRPPSSSKQTIRDLHSDQRRVLLQDHRAFVQKNLAPLQHYFAQGKEIDRRLAKGRPFGRRFSDRLRRDAKSCEASATLW
jgi:hypothetical protein